MTTSFQRTLLSDPKDLLHFEYMFIGANPALQKKKFQPINYWVIKNITAALGA